MFDFILATNTPAKVRDFLIDRGLGQMVDGKFVGTLRGLKFTASGIPNPIPEGRTGHGLRMYLFRFAFEMDEADTSDTGVVVDTGDPDPRFTKSRLARWVKNNGTPIEVDVSREGEAEPYMVTAWRITFDGGQFYLIRDNSKIGVWQ